MVANKSKTNYAHLEKTMKMTNPQKVKILQALHDNEVDPSILSVLKNILFEHESVVDNYLFPLSEWEAVRVYETNTILDNVNDLLVQEVKTPDGRYLDLQKFMDVIDLYSILPLKKQPKNNLSKDMFLVMSQGTKVKADFASVIPGGRSKKNLDLLWIKLEEKFSSLAKAYRYFDMNFDNNVSFGEFQKALDLMRVKFTVEELQEMFNYLDKDNKNYINYEDFCGLDEDRRMGFGHDKNIDDQKKRTQSKMETTSRVNDFLDN